MDMPLAQHLVVLAKVEIATHDGTEASIAA